MRVRPNGSARRRRRPTTRRIRLPATPSTRGPALLAAAVLGALAIGVSPAVLDRVPAGGQPVSTALASEGPEANFDGEADPRRDLALAGAAERVRLVQASRAQREEAEAERRSLPLAGVLTTAFAMRWGEMHWGVDIAAPKMAPEYAAAAGTVLRAGPASGYGNAIYIQHANGDVTVYGHMEKVLVEAGEVVASGQLIARVGSRGFSTGPHLHFEVWVGGLDGRRVDPLDWLAEQGIHL